MDSVINYSEHTDGGFYRSEDVTESLILSQYCSHFELLQRIFFTVATEVDAVTEKCRISMYLLGLCSIAVQSRALVISFYDL